MVGQGNVRDAQQNIFKTYTLEADLLNGKVHYTSKDGDRAIAYDGSSWNIQDASKRCRYKLFFATVDGTTQNSHNNW